MDRFATALTLDAATRVRDRHGIDSHGRCRYCTNNSLWPCSSYVLAYRVILRLTPPPEPPKETP
jgi:hypothetical protein